MRILNSNQNIDPKEYNYFEKLVNQRLKGKPTAYLIGKKDFWNNEFEVSKDTLIPRPDSELIVEEILIETKNKIYNQTDTVSSEEE